MHLFSNISGILMTHADRDELSKNKGVKYLKDAVDQGNSDAQHQLGSCYLFGKGVVKDEREAIRLFKLAADQGNVKAQFDLGNKYSIYVYKLFDYCIPLIYFILPYINNLLYIHYY